MYVDSFIVSLLTAITITWFKLNYLDNISANKENVIILKGLDVQLFLSRHTACGQTSRRVRLRGVPVTNESETSVL